MHELIISPHLLAGLLFFVALAYSAIGLGGGVYLAALIIAFGLGSPREAAACAAVFVWLNAFTGRVSRLQNQPVVVNISGRGLNKVAGWQGGVRANRRQV